MRSDADHYCDLLMGLDAALYHMREVISDHEECPGCTLCMDCIGMEHTTRIYFDLVYCDAPGDAVKRFRKETEIEQDELELLMKQHKDAPASVPPQEPKADRPAAIAELPAARVKPYWLA